MPLLKGTTTLTQRCLLLDSVPDTEVAPPLFAPLSGQSCLCGAGATVKRWIIKFLIVVSSQGTEEVTETPLLYQGGSVSRNPPEWPLPSLITTTHSYPNACMWMVSSESWYMWLLQTGPPYMVLKGMITVSIHLSHAFSRS